MYGCNVGPSISGNGKAHLTLSVRKTGEGWTIHVCPGTGTEAKYTMGGDYYQCLVPSIQLKDRKIFNIFIFHCILEWEAFISPKFNCHHHFSLLTLVNEWLLSTNLLGYRKCIFFRWCGVHNICRWFGYIQSECHSKGMLLLLWYTL